MSPAVCPLSAPSANYRIDPTSQIDRNNRTTPVQQPPRPSAMTRTVTAPRILHVSQGFTLHALPDHHHPRLMAEASNRANVA
jgi:hypothetical protein